MPVNVFLRLFGVLLPNCLLSRQNGFPSIDLILLDLEVCAAETPAETENWSQGCTPPSNFQIEAYLDDP